MASVARRILQAAQKGDEEALDAALADGEDLLQADEDGSGALHYAAKGGKAEMVGKLLKLGLKAQGANKNGHSALEVAAARGSVQCIKALASCAGKIGYEHKLGALKQAALYDRPNAVKALLDLLPGEDRKKALNAALFETIGQDASRCAQILLSSGADLTSQRNKLTVSEEAAGAGAVGCLQMFLEAGLADSPAKMRKALALAAKNAKSDALKLLLSRGAPADCETDGKSALAWTVQNKDKKSAAILLEHGADPEWSVEGAVSATELAKDPKHSGFAQIFAASKIKALENKGAVKPRAKAAAR